jgi:aspartate aminotransferase-like enzyme
MDHARRFSLDFDALECPWGQAIDLGAVRQKLERTPGTAWLWCVHCETSSGALTDMARLKDLCSEFQVKLCVDCISSVGTLPVDLRDIYLASCASGKGLRAYPGAAMVFYNHQLRGPSENLPRYLDLGLYAEQGGIPFTFSSNLLHALHAAIRRVPWDLRFRSVLDLSTWLRGRLIELGFRLVGNDTETSPAVITIALPGELNSVQIGNMMQESGYLLSYNSEYLRQKNWIQVCLMGECAQDKSLSLLNALNRLCFRRRPAKEAAGSPGVTA